MHDHILNSHCPCQCRSIGPLPSSFLAPLNSLLAEAKDAAAAAAKKAEDPLKQFVRLAGKAKPKGLIKKTGKLSASTLSMPTLGEGPEGAEGWLRDHSHMTSSNFWIFGIPPFVTSQAHR